MTSVRDVLVGARALVAKGWEPLAFARTADGKGCNPYDPGAVSFCAVAALLRAGEDLGKPARADEQLAFCEANKISMGGISNWNRHRTQAEVVAAFDLAIAACEVP